MANYPRLQVKVENFITPTELQQKLLDIISNDRVKRGVNQIIGNRANKYVPMKSGALRESMHVGPKTITWGEGLDYARYQYGGVVYEQNIPITSKGTIIGWYSKPGMSKIPTDRELGVPGEWKGWTFGYTTPNTKHHWIDEMLQHERRAMNNEITAYLKRVAKGMN